MRTDSADLPPSCPLLPQQPSKASSILGKLRVDCANYEASTIAAEVEPELFTMDAVRKHVNQVLAQQKAHYTEMLDRQVDTFNKFVRMLMDSTNEHLDS